MWDDFLAWLTEIPSAALYLLMGAIAAVENVFPPIPADTVVAFGSWLAARGEGSAIGAFLAVWLGNVAGAAGMYAVGRRHGAGWLRRKFPAIADEKNERRLIELHGKYGAAALVLSRFIPGVRAAVPPFAGALRLSPVVTMLSIAVASGAWYGMISYLAFKAGADWDALTQTVARSARIAAIAAVIIVAVVAAVWWLKRRSARSAR